MTEVLNLKSVVCSPSVGHVHVHWLTENKKEQLVKTLLSLSVRDRVRRLRAMPLSLAAKTELK